MSDGDHPLGSDVDDWQQELNSEKDTTVARGKDAARDLAAMAADGGQPQDQQGFSENFSDLMEAFESYIDKANDEWDLDDPSTQRMVADANFKAFMFAMLEDSQYDIDDISDIQETAMPMVQSILGGSVPEYQGWDTGNGGDSYTGSQQSGGGQEQSSGTPQSGSTDSPDQSYQQDEDSGQDQESGNPGEDHEMPLQPEELPEDDDEPMSEEERQAAIEEELERLDETGDESDGTYDAAEEDEGSDDTVASDGGVVETTSVAENPYEPLGGALLYIVDACTDEGVAPSALDRDEVRAGVEEFYTAQGVSYTDQEIADDVDRLYDIIDTFSADEQQSGTSMDTLLDGVQDTALYELFTDEEYAQLEQAVEDAAEDFDYETADVDELQDQIKDAYEDVYDSAQGAGVRAWQHAHLLKGLTAMQDQYGG